MANILITNNDHKKLGECLADIEQQATRVVAATAFFSSDEVVAKWLNAGRTVQLLVSLRPPTNYYSLKRLQTMDGIETRFLGKQFHSKFMIFFKGDVPFRSVIGSSNLTHGGLVANIETNVISDDPVFCRNMVEHFLPLWNKSYSLEPYDLERYKLVFDDFQKNTNEEVQNSFEKAVINDRNIARPKNDHVIQEAAAYLKFWRIVNQVKDIVNDLSVAEHPNIPVYLVIDHFWHWVKVIWGKENSALSAPDGETIRRMFSQYCLWDKSNERHLENMYRRSEDIFKKLLSREHIMLLTPDEAKTVYSSLHFGESRSTRFSSHEAFVKKNAIEKIRFSLNYLLYSTDDVTVKIHNMAKNESYRLDEVGLSGIQEILGWVYTEKYPIRNGKADAAIEMLGFRV